MYTSCRLWSPFFFYLYRLFWRKKKKKNTYDPTVPQTRQQNTVSRRMLAALRDRVSNESITRKHDNDTTLGLHCSALHAIMYSGWVKPCVLPIIFIVIYIVARIYTRYGPHCTVQCHTRHHVVVVGRGVRNVTFSIWRTRCHEEKWNVVGGRCVFVSTQVCRYGRYFVFFCLENIFSLWG